MDKILQFSPRYKTERVFDYYNYEADDFDVS